MRSSHDCKAKPQLSSVFSLQEKTPLTMSARANDGEEAL